MNESTKKKRGRPRKTKEVSIKKTKNRKGLIKRDNTTTDNNESKFNNQPKTNEEESNEQESRESNDTSIKVSKEPSKVKDKKSKHIKSKGQTTINEVNNKKTRKECYKNESKTKKVRRRVRNFDEHQEAIRYLKKRLYFAKCDKRVHQYESMIRKLESTTEII